MKQTPHAVPFTVFSLVLACCFFFTCPSRADQGTALPSEDPQGSLIQLDTEHLELDASSWQARAEGEVRIHYEGITLNADEALLDIEKKESFAKGHVRLLHGADILTCDSIFFHWESQTGFLENGDLYVEETGYHVRASRMEKTGLDTYSMEQGTFTTCDCPSPDDVLPWEVSAQDAEVTLGGYARLRKATFRVFRIPVFYLPRGYLPVKLNRESGFLVPRVGQSGSNGWSLALPYFWAVDASKDATVTLEGLTKRGFKPSVEARYRPSRGTSGEWNGSVFQDLEDNRVRYGLTATHDQSLSSHFYDKLHLNLVSDNDYVEDFPGEVGSTADRLLESGLSVGYRSEDVHVALESIYSDLVEGPGGTAIAQRGPQIFASIVRHPVGINGLSFSWLSESTYFFNEDGEERVRSQYMPRGYVLVNLLPGLTLQGHAGVRELLSSGTMEPFLPDPSAMPGFSTNDTRHRTLVEAGAELHARLSRGYRWGAYRLHHFVQPRVQYQWIRKVEGEPLPVVMDGLDDLNRRNWVTYSLRSSLWGKRLKGQEKGAGGLLAEAYVVQSLDIEQDREDSPDARLFSDILTALLMHPRPWLSFAANLQFDPEHGSVRVIETGVSVWEKKRRYGAYAGYLKHKSHRVDPITRVELVDVYDRNYAFPGIEHTLRTRLEAKPFTRLTASLDTLYLLEHSGKIENHLSVIYLSKCKCWSIIMRLRNTVRPDDIGFSVRFRLEGLGETL